jgi:hypothetical protein
VTVAQCQAAWQRLLPGPERQGGGPSAVLASPQTQPEAMRVGTRAITCIYKILARYWRWFNLAIRSWHVTGGGSIWLRSQYLPFITGPAEKSLPCAPTYLM